jgi:hypothetical protein
MYFLLHSDAEQSIIIDHNRIVDPAFQFYSRNAPGDLIAPRHSHGKLDDSQPGKGGMYSMALGLTDDNIRKYMSFYGSEDADAASRDLAPNIASIDICLNELPR